MKHIVVVFCLLILAVSIRSRDIGTIPPSLSPKELRFGIAAFNLAQLPVADAVQYFYQDTSIVDTSALGPMGILATMPFVTLFGVSAESIRWPSVLAGSFTVGLVYLLGVLCCSKFFSKKQIRYNKVFPVICAVLLAVSPWHIQISRLDTGLNIGILFLLSAMIAFCVSKPVSRFFFLIPVLGGFAVMSDFNLFIPVLFIGCFLFRKQDWKKIFIAVCIFGVFLLPFTHQIQKTQMLPDQAATFYRLESRELGKKRIINVGGTVLSKLVTNPFITESKYIISSALSYTEPVPYFFGWMYNNTQLTSLHGLFFPFELFFLIVGCVWIWKTYRSIINIVIVGLVLFFWAEALRTDVPDAFRIGVLSIGISPFIALGIIKTISAFQRQYIIPAMIFIFLVYLLAFGNFTALFRKNSLPYPDFYMEYQQAFLFLDRAAPDRPVVVVDTTYGKDIALLWMYKTQQRNVYKEYEKTESAVRFGSYIFVPSIPQQLDPETIYIVPLKDVKNPMNPSLIFGEKPSDKITIISAGSYLNTTVLN